MMSNPNTNAAALASAIGVLISWLLGHFHVELSAEDGATLAGGLSVLVLYIGRDGLRGVFCNLWRGQPKPPPPPPTVGP